MAGGCQQLCVIRINLSEAVLRRRGQVQCVRGAQESGCWQGCIDDFDAFQDVLRYREPSKRAAAAFSEELLKRDPVQVPGNIALPKFPVERRYHFGSAVLRANDCIRSRPLPNLLVARILKIQPNEIG